MLGGAATPAFGRSGGSRIGHGLGGELVGLDRAGLAEWSRQVGSEFVVAAEGGTAALTLIAVEPRPSEGVRPGRIGRDHAFAAIFDASSAAMRGDRIYAVNHPVSGTMSVYFSPADSGRIVALFN
jgi:hypothetical protein